MKKLLFLIPNLAHGGAEKVLVNLVNNLDKSKFDVTVQVLFSGGINEQFLHPDVKYKYCYKKSFSGNSHYFKLYSPRLLFNRFIKEKYDTIVSYLEGPTARIVSGCTDKNTKLICWIHVQQETKAIACASFRNYNEAKACYERFDKIVCVSEDVKKSFISNFAYTRTVDILYNTNETTDIIKRAKEKVSDYNFDPNIPCLIGIGTLKKSKGFDKLIRIHKRLLDNGIIHKVIVLGVGSEEKNLKSLISELHVNNSFTLLGYQNNPYKYLDSSSLFVCASSAEGFSTAATESLILGVPVCTVNVSGMKEMLGEKNEYGIVTDNNEEALYFGIKKLLENRELLAHYKVKALERGKLFSTKNTVNAVEKMLLSL